MKRVTAMLVIALLLLPAAAWADSSTDAALGLGAFAVFNQILSGTGVFARSAPVVVVPPPVYAPPPVYYAPPPPVYHAPPPAVYYAPRPVYVAPPPVVVYRSAPSHFRGDWHGHGHAKHWRKHSRHDRD